MGADLTIAIKPITKGKKLIISVMRNAIEASSLLFVSACLIEKLLNIGSYHLRCCAAMGAIRGDYCGTADRVYREKIRIEGAHVSMICI